MYIYTLIKFLIISIALIALILSYFQIADKYHIIDKPNNRSSHNYITIRGGGIIFYLGVLLYTLNFGLSFQYFMLGLSLISIVSFLDDVYDISLRIRISIHFISMMLMFYDCELYNFPWYYLISALIISTGIINAYNFMDGINGMTGGYSLIVILSFWWINNKIHPFIDNNFLYVIIISLLIFNFYNFRKIAKCFAGDVGSVSIAFVIVFLMGKLIAETGKISYLILLMLYGVDSILTIIHRLILKENIFRAHRKHLYQILSNELKVPHTYVSMIYMLTQFLIMVGYFYIIDYPLEYFIFIGIMLTITYVYIINRYLKIQCTN